MEIENYNWNNHRIDITSHTLHTILAMGSLDDIKKTIREVGIEKARTIFIERPVKIYTPASYNFAKVFILKIHTQIDEKKYLKSTSRNIG